MTDTPAAPAPAEPYKTRKVSKEIIDPVFDDLDRDFKVLYRLTIAVMAIGFTVGFVKNF